MAEPNRPTREVVYLTNTDDEMPTSGAKVYALSLGGVMCEIIWRADSHKHYAAWMYYPKIPDDVKKKLYDQYCNGGWGKHGTQVQRDDRPQTEGC